VRNALEALFQGDRINLQLHDHKKVYYRNIVDMLAAIDASLHETFLQRWDELVSIADA
jgi:hypothetical protein